MPVCCRAPRVPLASESRRLASCSPRLHFAHQPSYGKRREAPDSRICPTTLYFLFFFFFFALANRRLFSVLGGLGAPVVICANLSYPPTRHFLAEMRALVFAPVDTASFGCPCNFRQILLHAGDLCCCCRCLHDSRFSLRLIRSLFFFSRSTLRNMCCLTWLGEKAAACNVPQAQAHTYTCVHIG